MAIQFCDGFDQYSSQADVQQVWNRFQQEMAITLEDDTPYGRGKAIKFGKAGASHPGISIQVPNPVNQVGCSFHLKVLEYPTSSYYRGLIEFKDGTSSDTHCTLSLNANGTLRFNARDASSSISNYVIVAETIESIPLNTWVHVEVRVLISNSGTVEIRINGNFAGSGSGDTYTGNSAVVNVITAGRQVYSGANSAGIILMDNFVFWDTTGSTNNTFLGEVEVATLAPVADVDITDWTPSEGSDGYAMIVDEEGFDGDDTYIASDVEDAVAVFELGNLPSVNMRVLGVQAFAVARKDESGDRSLALGVDSDDEVVDASPSPLSNVYTGKMAFFENDPATGIAWQRSAVNAVKLRTKVV